jgi:hypothetical protein
MDCAALDWKSKHSLQEFGIDAEPKDMLAFGLARNLDVFEHEGRGLRGAGPHQKIGETQPRIFAYDAFLLSMLSVKRSLCS